MDILANEAANAAAEDLKEIALILEAERLILATGILKRHIPSDISDPTWYTLIHDSHIDIKFIAALKSKYCKKNNDSSSGSTTVTSYILNGKTVPIKPKAAEYLIYHWLRNNG